MVAQQQFLTTEKVDLGWAGRRLTAAEFDSIKDWDDAFRYELIQGVLIVSPAPDAGERHPNNALGGMLYMYAQLNPQGAIIDDSAYECDVRTARGIRRVDRAIWIGLGRPPKIKKDVPAVLVEFVSEGRRNAYRDYVEKRDEYLQIGVREYWIIDRFDRTMTVFSGTTDAPIETVVTEQDVYTTPLLPGFQLPLQKLLEVADRYQD